MHPYDYAEDAVVRFRARARFMVSVTFDDHLQQVIGVAAFMVMVRIKASVRV